MGICIWSTISDTKFIIIEQQTKSWFGLWCIYHLDLHYHSFFIAFSTKAHPNTHNVLNAEFSSTRFCLMIANCVLKEHIQNIKIDWWKVKIFAIHMWMKNRKCLLLLIRFIFYYKHIEKIKHHTYLIDFSIYNSYR